jgi:1-aminocyclopropane-1-carboxylate deaminase/D-cysteine desulfhydrase-like pyridoxal-dependent ACC family enzyme
VAEIVEFGSFVIAKEMDALRRLHASLLSGGAVHENGVDVTAREAALLGLQIAALEAALIRLAGPKS